MNLKFHISAFAASLLIGLSSFSQDYEQDMAKIAAVYGNADQYAMELSYTLYKDYTTQEAMETGKTTMKKNGANFYSKNFSIETVVNQRYVLSLDHDSKILMIDRSQKGQHLLSTSPVVPPDSVIASLNKVFGDREPLVGRKEYEKLSASKAAYTIHYNYGEYQKITIVFNTKTYVVHKAILYYRNPVQFVNNAPATKPRIEMLYERFDKKPSFSKTEFSETAYLRVKANNELIINAEYANYTVINHLNDKR